MEETTQNNRNVIKLTKIEAARRQINTAIRMFFNDMDSISIHAVLAGGLQIVTDLAELKQKEVGFTWFVSAIIPERREEFMKMLREPQNFVKHADRTGDDTITYEYNVDALEIYLYLASQAYEIYTGKATPETRAVSSWISFRNPQILVESELKKSVGTYLETFGEVGDKDKEMFIKLIQRLREEHTIDPEEMDYSD